MQYAVKSLTAGNIEKLIIMLKVLAPDYSTHMVVTADSLSNTQSKYPAKIDMHQVVYFLLRQKMAAVGINTDIVNNVKNNKVNVKDINWLLQELYNKFVKVYPPEL